VDARRQFQNHEATKNEVLMGLSVITDEIPPGFKGCLSEALAWRGRCASEQKRTTSAGWPGELRKALGHARECPAATIRSANDMRVATESQYFSGL